MRPTRCAPKQRADSACDSTGCALSIWPATTAATAWVSSADLLLVTGPLYRDSLPYPGLLALEQIHAERRKSGPRSARLMAVVS